MVLSESAYAHIVDGVVDARKNGHEAGLFKIQESEFDQYDLVPVSGDGTKDQIFYYRLVPAIHNVTAP